jgi:hypothetical protein
MNNHNLLVAIRNQIEDYKSFLITPNAISEIKDYKYYVGLIRGLETAYDFVEQNFKNRDQDE